MAEQKIDPDLKQSPPRDDDYQARLLEARGKCNRGQVKFCEAYVYTCNFSPFYAAKEAGYAHPDRYGWVLMKSPNVKEYIDVLMEGTQVKVEEITALLLKQATFNPTRYYRIEEEWEKFEGHIINPETGAEELGELVRLKGRHVWIDIEAIKADGYGQLVKKFKWDANKQALEVEFYDAQKALELLGRSKGMFVDKQEWSGEVPMKAYVAWDPAMWDQVPESENPT